MACSTVSHEKALHIKYFIPYLNLRNIYRNFWKFRKDFKPNFEELLKTVYENFGKSSTYGFLQKLLENFGNNSEVFSRYFYDFLKFSENFGNGSKAIFSCFNLWLFKNFQKIFGNHWKCSEIFRNFRKTLEMVQKVIFRCFHDFLKFSENVRKSLEVFENLWHDQKCS